MLRVDVGVMYTPNPLVAKVTASKPSWKPPEKSDYVPRVGGQTHPADDKLPQALLYLEDDVVSRIETTVSRQVLRERLTIIEELRDKQGFGIGALCVLKEDYPVKDWTHTDVYWVEQYLLSTELESDKWYPLLIGIQDDNDVILEVGNPKELVVLGVDDFEDKCDAEATTEDVPY